MKAISRAIAATALLGLAAGAAGSGDSTPFKNGEVLRYEVVWPSGLSLGEAHFEARANQAGWTFTANITADLPAFKVDDRYRSEADFEICSRELTKRVRHGAKESEEKVEYDQQEHVAHRVTLGGGGESEFAVPPCARDALTYLYFLRRDLANGRIPPPDDVNFGAQYVVTVSYADPRKVEAAGKTWDTDRILVDVTGPDSQRSIEFFIGKDEARTPVLIRSRFDLGVFALRLVE